MLKIRFENEKRAFIFAPIMKKKRLQQLMDLLQERQNLDCFEAAEYLGVSLPTIRRDFAWLADKGMARRFHGGIAVLDGNDNSVFPIALRHTLDMNQKREIAALVAKEIPESGALFIDGGTTTACLAPFLSKPNLHVITNSLTLLHCVEEMSAPHAHLTMTGGDYHRPTGNLLGLEAVRTISHYHVDLSIISCTALDENYLYDDPEASSAIQRAMFENSERVIVMADACKLGKHALYKSLPIEKIQALFTNYTPDKAEIIESIRKKGVDVFFA